MEAGWGNLRRMQPASTDPNDYLRELGERGEGPHDITQAALMLAALDHTGRSRAPYEAHLQEIGDAGRDELGSVRHAEEAAHVLSSILAGRFAYCGDRIGYDDPQNADLMAVIERRRGLSVALGVLYIHAARSGRLEARGLNTPGHFLLRISVGNSTALIDPFNGGALVDRKRLTVPPGMMSADPDEPVSFGRPVSDADVLLRLQNNIKIRALKAGDHTHAIEIASRMVMIAPARPSLWIELAGMLEAGGALRSAMNAYQSCLDVARSGAALHNEAALALAGLKRRLN